MSIIKSLSRGLTIIELLGKSEKSLGVTEISKELGVDKSSATRLIQTLIKHEFAIKDPESRRFLLGPKIHSLANFSTQSLPLKTISLPLLQRLMEKTGENSHVAIYSQEKCLVVADIESTAQLRVVSGEGRLIPNHCTAIGKCIIAFADHPMPKDLAAHTPRTITSRDQFKLHLEQVRDRGYALDDEEHEYGVRCMAAPIYDEAGKAIASLGISGPTVRVTLDKVPELSKVVMQAARELSELLKNYDMN
ncbi:MAG: IclR family KDG regulon transcriptional repressor [Cellvibrionaceae bacterium]|jgi:IclR family KDG regulon transcriptional repressor